ncbi:hypothetical protein ACFOFO_24090 [Undibacterium arcticum]|uniref:Uncharacterized protein n=1 Tax=Undibacterium arcticum TaxID=1762892 RepID=A0ABV7FAP9_9BURK
MEADRLQQEALAIAACLAAGSQAAQMHTKRALNHWLRMAWPAFEVSLHAEIQRFSSADAREGLASIRGKRQAVFT